MKFLHCAPRPLRNLLQPRVAGLLWRILALLWLALCAALPAAAQAPLPQPDAAQATPAHSGPTAITFGLYVTSLSGISPSDGSFTVSGYAWFLAPPGAAFDPAHDVELFGRTAQMRPFAASTLEDGTHYSVITFSAVIDQAFDVSRYPFDRQALQFYFEAAQSAQELTFVPDTADTRIAQEVRAPGFRLNGIDLEAREIAYDTGFGHRGGSSAFSRLLVTLHLERNISPLLFEKFTGFFVAFAITALVIFVPVSELGTRVGMTTGSIFAAVFNLYRLEDAIGFDAVFGVVEKVSILVFSMILLQLSLSLWTHYRSRAALHAMAIRVNYALGGLIILLHGALLVAVFVSALH